MAATDLLTLEEANAAISMTGSGAKHGFQVSMLVSAISEWIDAEVGPVVIRTIANERHDADGLDSFTLRYQPVSSITSISEYLSGTGTAVTLEDHDTSGGYWLQDGRVYRRNTWSDSTWTGIQLVTYEAGRYSSTATTGAKYKMAATAVLAGAWRKYSAAWSNGSPLEDPDIAGTAFFDEFRPALSILRHEAVGDLTIA